MIQIKIIATLVALAALTQIGGCAFVMCHPYKLVSLCEIVAPDGLVVPDGRRDR